MQMHYENRKIKFYLLFIYAFQQFGKQSIGLDAGATPPSGVYGVQLHHVYR